MQEKKIKIMKDIPHFISSHFLTQTAITAEAWAVGKV
jgi:hypothetical protein